MKGITNDICVIALGMAFAGFVFSAPIISCYRFRSGNHLTIKGTVASEQYYPGSDFLTGSRYFFSLDTTDGRKSFRVESRCDGNSIESIDALISPGQKVEVKVLKDRVDTTYDCPDYVRVLQ